MKYCELLCTLHPTLNLFAILNLTVLWIFASFA